MAHPLDGCLAKLNRGEEQLHALKDAVNMFRASRFFEATLEIDRKERPIVRATNVRDPPESLAILVGECANSFRSALDYLAYQLAILQTGDPLPDMIAKATQFPIYATGPKYRNGAPRHVQGMAPKARAAIERLQPYHRKRVPNAIALQWLNETCSVDKHRELHPVGSMLVGSQFGIASNGGPWSLERIDVFPGPLTDGAMLARFVGEFSGRIHFTANGIFDVVFAPDSKAPSVRKESVLFTMTAIRDFICSELMPALAAFFPGDYEYTVESAQ
jgi:hypothetical protein